MERFGLSALKQLLRQPQRDCPLMLARRHHGCLHLSHELIAAHPLVRVVLMRLWPKPLSNRAFDRNLPRLQMARAWTGYRPAGTGMWAT